MLAFKGASCHSDSKALLCAPVAGSSTAGKNLPIKVHARGEQAVRKQAKSQKWLLKAQVTPEVVQPEEDLVDNRLSATVSGLILENILRWTVLHIAALSTAHWLHYRPVNAPCCLQQHPSAAVPVNASCNPTCVKA